MITDLTLISDQDLAKMEVAMSERGHRIITKDGKAEAYEFALRMIHYIMDCGYRLPSIDPEGMAAVWAGQLEEAIIIYGYDDIARVVKVWAKEDDREYKQFPTTGTIIAKVKELLGNPVAEIARRNHEAMVEQMAERERKELLKGVTEEHLNELQRRYQNEQS
jgi:hypothetical protein